MANEEKKIEENKCESPKKEFCSCADLRVFLIALLTSIVVVAGYHAARVCIHTYLRSKNPPQTVRSCKCGHFRRGKFAPGKSCPGEFVPGRPDGRPGKFAPGKPGSRRGKHGRKPWMKKSAPECGQEAPAPKAAPAEAPKTEPKAAPAAKPEAKQEAKPAK